jgi:hypothetical protein
MIIRLEAMKKALIGMVLVSVLGACTEFILPEDTRIIAADAGVSRTIANYSGTWEGSCGEQECRIVIEAIEPPKVRAIYAWGKWKRP